MRSLHPPDDMAQLAERMITNVVAMRQAEAIALSGAITHEAPPRVRDLDAEVASLIQVKLYEATGDHIDLRGVALPIARAILDHVTGYIEREMGGAW